MSVPEPRAITAFLYRFVIFFAIILSTSGYIFEAVSEMPIPVALVVALLTHPSEEHEEPKPPRSSPSAPGAELKQKRHEGGSAKAPRDVRIERLRAIGELELMKKGHERFLDRITNLHEELARVLALEDQNEQGNGDDFEDSGDDSGDDSVKETVQERLDMKSGHRLALDDFEREFWGDRIHLLE